MVGCLTGIKAETRKNDQSKQCTYPLSAATSPESLGKGKETPGHGSGLPTLMQTSWCVVLAASQHESHKFFPHVGVNP